MVGVAVICGLGLLLSYGGTFAFVFATMADSKTDLVLNGTTCLKKSALSDNPTVYLRERSNFTQADALATLTALDPGGNIVPFSPEMSVTLEIPSGIYRSVAKLDLATFADDDEICIETAGVPAILNPGDLVVMSAFIGKLLTAIFTCCLANVVFVGLGITSVIFAIKRFIG